MCAEFRPPNHTQAHLKQFIIHNTLDCNNIGAYTIHKVSHKVQLKVRCMSTNFFIISLVSR